MVLEEAGGEGDGVVSTLGWLVDVFAKQECVGVAVAVEDESIGGQKLVLSLWRRSSVLRRAPSPR